MTRAIASGAIHLPGFLDVESQRGLAGRCRELMDGDPAGYVPTVRGGRNDARANALLWGITGTARRTDTSRRGRTMTAGPRRRCREI
jgi:hypothetical protein